MGTVAAICRQTNTGKIESVNVFFDGYLKGGVGEVLARYYRDAEAVAGIFALGDMSRLGKDIDYPNTISYHRDRDELWDDVCPKIYDNISDVLDSGCDYVYLFDGLGWTFADYRNKKFKEVIL